MPMRLQNPNVNQTKNIQMNRFLFSLLALVLMSNILLAQNKNYEKHTVEKGETITQIATKYSVTPYDIYQLNPDSQKGIKENDVILIPVSQVKTASIIKSKTDTNRTHVATPKETLYSIARDYNVSVADLKSLNAEAFASGLRIGQTVKIPDTNSDVPSTPKEVPKEIVVVAKPTSPTVSQSSKENNIFHIVEPKETKFG
jgi:LysM repeat protein